jgi:antitoxin PrlF
MMVAEAYSKVSAKSQTVIPKPVRQRLGLKPGDMLRFRLIEEGVMLERVQPVDEDPFVSFGEWNSDEDERLYRDL